MTSSPDDVLLGRTNSVRPPAGILLLAVLVLAASLYALLPARTQTGDSLAYAQAIRSGEELFHPHHLAFNPAVRGVWRVLKIVDPAATPIGAAQVHNVLWALVALSAVFGIIKRMTASPRTAALAALALAGCLGFWQYATYVEVYLPAMGCLALCLRALGGSREGGSFRRIAAATAGFVLAVLYHQMSVLFAPAFFLLIAEPGGRKARLRGGAALVAAGAAVGLVYTVSYSLVSGPPTLAGLIRWSLSYAYHPNPHWGTLANVTPLGAAKLFLGQAQNIVFIPEAAFLPAAAVYGAAWLLLMVVTLRAIRRRAPQSRARLALLVWMAAAGAFVLWFSPYGHELSIPLLLPLAILAAAAIRDAVVSARRPERARRTAGVAAAAAAILLFAVNGIFAVWPAHAGPGEAYEEAARLQSALPDRASVIVDFDVRENLRYHFNRTETFDRDVVLYSFYRKMALPPTHSPDPDLPVVIPAGTLRPDSRDLKGYDGFSHPEEWSAFFLWIIQMNRGDTRWAEALPVGRGYVSLGPGPGSAISRAEIFRLLDDLLRDRLGDPSAPFSAWGNAHPPDLR